MNRVLIALMVFVASGCAQSTPDQQTQSAPAVPGDSRIYKLGELTWPEIDGLNRQQTMFILPMGMLEEHGPHLPIGADTIGVTYETDQASRRVSQALPDWNIVIMPPVHYGHGGANQLGNMLVHPGTYSIGQSTLRSLVADLGAQVAENGFKWIFVTNGHGAPRHGIAINEACDFVSEKYRVTMLNLSGLFNGDPSIQAKGEQLNGRFFSTAELSSFGMDVHAGVRETSAILALRSDLVKPNYKALPSQAGNSLEALHEIAARPGWQGYLSSPAKATAELGQAIEEWWIEGFTDLILRAVRGENMSGHPRFPETVPPAVAPILEKTHMKEVAFETELEQWMMRRSRGQGRILSR
jgi:creatinine amidohydrolase